MEEEETLVATCAFVSVVEFGFVAAAAAAAAAAAVSLPFPFFGQSPKWCSAGRCKLSHVGSSALLSFPLLSGPRFVCALDACAPFRICIMSE